MDVAVQWYIILGVLFFAMAVSHSYVKGLPLTTAIIYLVIGFALGPYGLELLKLDPVKEAKWLERVTELVVIVSLFAAGLKLRLPLRDRNWWGALRLATFSMWVTILAIAGFAHYVLGLPFAASVLLGSILAPTDPVLASEVQVAGPDDRDKVRFGLTGEAGLNDGTAFPFVMLGLGLVGHHELGPNLRNWVLIDLIWATFVGLFIGSVVGTAVAKFATYLRHQNRETTVLDDFLALGVIAISYGLSIALHAYGFLAVFAAGVALRRIERIQSGEKQPALPEEKTKVHPEHTPALLARDAMIFDEQLERIGEVTTVLIVGSLLFVYPLELQDLWLLPFLFLIVRPFSVWAALWKSKASRSQLHYLSWFGIRGIGSLYYLMYAIGHGIDRGVAERLTSITIATVAFSIVIHGISVTPLMRKYEKKVADAL